MPVANGRPRTSAPRCTRRRVTRPRWWLCSRTSTPRWATRPGWTWWTSAPGQGELLSQLLALAGPALAGRICAHAIEVAPRPPGLDERLRWSAAPPERVTGLVIASEWLDNIPLDVAELAGAGRGWCW